MVRDDYRASTRPADITAAMIVATVLVAVLVSAGRSDKEVPKSEARSEHESFLATHPLLTGAAVIRSPGQQPSCQHSRYPTPARDTDRDQGSRVDYEEDDLVDGMPFGRPRRRGVGRRGPPDESDDEANDEDGECRVKFGLHYSSCFDKHDDFDNKYDALQQQRGGSFLQRGGGGVPEHMKSPCQALQLIAKVRSSPVWDRCAGRHLVVRTPYQMYNVQGELRYIVQDPPHLQQCYLEAACSHRGDARCRRVGVGCESRRCHHTLLAWDPQEPDAGTFFDLFEYACCCSCHRLPPAHHQHQLQPNPIRRIIG